MPGTVVWRGVGRGLPSDGGEPVVCIRRLSHISEVEDELVAIYGTVFSGAPYHEGSEKTAAFAHWLRGLDRHEDVIGYVAETEQRRRKIIGFSLGHALTESDRQIVAPQIGKAAERDWLPDCFLLAELAVLPAYRGRGLGGELHDRLMAQVGHRTAVLGTHPSETAATRLYRARGWQTLFEPPVGQGSPPRVMGLRLRGATGAWNSTSVQSISAEGIGQ